MDAKKRFDHKYKSCSRTYATLCIHHKSVPSSKVTGILRIKPDRISEIGDKAILGKTVTRSGWYLTTRERKRISKSRDCMFHIDWILDQVSAKKPEINKLIELGFTMHISCFWGSVSGNGGPMLDHELIIRLSEFPFEVWWDVWFDGE